MLTKVNVRINTIQHTTQVSSAGNTLNYIEITGFNETENRGFKKRFFSTKKDGTATKNAETADTLNKDDWVEFTLDDTTYANVQTLRKIAAPAGAQAPSQGGSTGSAGGGGNRMSKADWAAKDRAKAESIARSVALKEAVNVSISQGNTDPDEIIGLARHFADWLVNGDVSPEPAGQPQTQSGDPGAGADDDIPF